MPCLLDPSAPGVTKQMMVDWMHINHPQTAIRPRIDPTSLANLVRSKQPEYFPDPTSNALAHEIRGQSNKDQSDTTSTGVSSVVGRYPKIESPIEDIKPRLANQPGLPLSKIPAKRSAPSEAKRSPKDAEKGSESRGEGSKSSKKKKVTHAVQSINTPPPPAETANRMDVDPPSSNLHGQYTRVSRDFIMHEDQDLKDLKSSLAFTWSSVPLKHRGKGTEKAARLNPDGSKHRAASNQPQDTNITEVELKPDLIEFSDHECMDSENIVIGRDIPAISSTPASGKIKSGADVFLEERRREDRLLQLEEFQKEVLEKLENLNIDLFRSRCKVEEQDCRIQSLEASNEILNKKCEELGGTIEEQVADLQDQTTKIRTQLEMDRFDILVHEGMLERLADMDEDEEDEEDGSEEYEVPGQDQDDEE